MENRIETADFLEGPFVKGHVAAGDVFCLRSVNITWAGPPGETMTAAATGDRPGAADYVRLCRQIPSEQTADQIVKPVFVRPAIGVGESDDFARGSSDTGVRATERPWFSRGG